MNVVVAVSGYIIPAVMLFIVIHGMIKKVNVYDEFVTGAKDGMKTVVSIAPTLVGLMMAVGVLRASGFLDMVSGFIGKFTGKIGGCLWRGMGVRFLFYVCPARLGYTYRCKFGRGNRQWVV